MENIEKSEFSQNQALSNFMSIDSFLCQKHLFLNLSKSPTEIQKSVAGKIKICKWLKTLLTKKSFSKIKLMDLFIKMHFNISVEKIYLHANV